MIIVKAKNYNDLSKKAANIIFFELKNKKNLKIVLPTGKTPLGMYKILRKNKKIFSKTFFFNLDEYYPVKKNDKNSFSFYLYKNFFEKINSKNVHLINSENKDFKKECKNYEKKLGRPDLVILGTGINGHIAFNEPHSNIFSKTRLVKISKTTKKINKTKFNYALTIGISTILKSKKIIILASGKEKSNAIKHLLEKKIDKNWPLTYLLNHKNVILIADKAALASSK